MSYTSLAIAGIDRYESWRSAMADAFGPFEVQPREQHFTGQLRYQRRVGLQFNDLRYAGQNIERTRGNASHLSEEFYTFGMPMSGPLTVERRGDAFDVAPGCLYLMNQGLPYKALAHGEGGFRSLSISIPSAALLLRSRHLPAFCKLDLAGSPRGSMLRSYLGQIFENLDLWSDQELSAICEHFIDLVSIFLIRNEDCEISESDSSVSIAHRARIFAYIRLHLSDPDLDAEKVAQGCHMSTRYLYKILRKIDVSVEAYIFEQRILKCRELLASRADRMTSIAELCYRCGFRQPAHFSRLFKARYGESPRSFRARACGIAAPSAISTGC